jgi:hypothetical protein
MKKEDKEKIVDRALGIINDLLSNGFSNYRIAQETKVTETTIGNWVNGVTKPTPANAKIIIDHYAGRIHTSSGANNMGLVGDNSGTYVAVADPAAKKIIEGNRIEITREVYAEERLLQEVNRLKTEIEGLKSTLKSKEETIMEKDRTIDALNRMIELLSDKNKG